MALTPFQGTLGIKRAAHLLRRAAFGGTRPQIDALSNMTAADAVDLLFLQELPDTGLPIDPQTGGEWVLSGNTEANSEESTLQEYFKRWLIGQMLKVDDLTDQEKIAYNAREKITLWMHTHFTTKQSKVNSSRALYFQNQLFRKFAFDKAIEIDPEVIDQDLKEWRNFKELLKKICLDNAMLQFLDGRLNVSGNPNENYARELLELYAIGRGLEGTLPTGSGQGDYFNYTEQDVQEAARVLSGFTTDSSFSNIDPDTELPRGVVRGGQIASAHDNDLKIFSERFDNQVVQPDQDLLLNEDPTEESAIEEISQLIEIIFSKEETVRHICRKLYRFFVYHEISQEIEDNVISELTNTFIDGGYRLHPVLVELFSSDHFYGGVDGYSDDNFGGLIKSPLDLVVGTIRFFEIDIPDYETDLENYYSFMGNLLRTMDLQGMNFYEPFEVAGYSAYHQFPIYNRNWISTNYLTRRYEFIQLVSSMEAMMEPNQAGFDILDYLKLRFAESGANARELVMQLTKYLLPVHENLTFDETADDDSEITSERINYFLFAFLYSPQFDADPEQAWTSRWDTLFEKELMDGQLRELLNAMLQSPEYQLA